MKAILLQLPVQGHDFFYSNENIPLACAYLQAIGKKHGIDAALLPQHLMSYGSDQAILQFLLEARPDLVGMSCYLWNVERSLFLARQLKQLLPLCRVVMGGPEITPDNLFLLQRGAFDIGVVGEGEEAWEHLLQSFPEVPESAGLLLPGKDGAWHFSGKRLRQSPPGRWPSPLLDEGFDSHLDKVVWLETVRGCTYHCAYCHYHKQSPSLRVFPLERIFHEVLHAWQRGFEEIVFLDPCFTKRPGLDPLLEELAAINYDRRLHFHAECNAEEIEPRTAGKMGRAGFKEVEVGLQTTKKGTLRRVHRSFDPERFLQGVHLLQESGIEVMVDVIAGLPGDHLSDICRSLDWVLDHEAYDSLMLYPLSLLPATELKQRADKWELSGLPTPPYLVTRGPGLTAREICGAFEYYAKRMEEDVSPLEMPPALNLEAGPLSLPGGLCHAINWHSLDQVRSLADSGHRAAYGLTISLTFAVLKQSAVWAPALREYLEHNPFSHLSVEVPPDVYPEDLRPFWELSRRREQLIDRDYTVAHTPYRSFLLFSRSRGLVWKWPDPREERPVLLPDGQEIPCHPVCLVAGSGQIFPRWFLEHMSKRYPSLPEIRLWELPDKEVR